ncbi:probable glycosyltransferase At5g03795 isoform X1 [Selaginella moellendorffii]|nr:probable glycosyltransferase At5g03795 isoform X1 [Selaginella moellendorffii]|eukprot:XP_002972221.2 probable glycosyltransferase At5g03795 isoform X1 [Selaginella moellendorffii]
MASDHSGAPARRRGKDAESSSSCSARRWILGLVFLLAACSIARMALVVSDSPDLPPRAEPWDQQEQQEEQRLSSVESQSSSLEEDRRHPEQGMKEKIFLPPPALAQALAQRESLRVIDTIADNGPYHSRRAFLDDYRDMVNTMKVFVYPCSPRDPFSHIFLPTSSAPSGNYASEAYFKKALAESGMVTDDPSQADLFFMPFSITRLRNDPKVGVGRMPAFVRDYVKNISHRWPYWNRTGGSDHFYVACHSIGKVALEKAQHVRLNAIQVVCSSNYYVQGFIPHKDVAMPQIWPRSESFREIKTIEQRKVLAFFAGGSNSPVRANVVRTWRNDTQIHAYPSRIQGSYAEALLRSKFCLHVKGYEVNTARLGDAFFYGCVPVVIANYYDLPFSSVLNWKSFSVVVTTANIPKLKAILSGISREDYSQMHRLVLDARRHFQWHAPPREYDAFYMVMYQLWLRRHVVRYPLH